MVDAAHDAVRWAVRNVVYATFAAQGRPPSPIEIASELGLPIGDVVGALRGLHDAHALVLTPAGDAIRMAHPFSAAPMGFVVTAPGRSPPTGYQGDRMWWGGCAWDSFGIGAALGETVRILASCPGCGRAFDVTASAERGPRVEAVVHLPWPARRWWDDVVLTCSNIRLFCSEDHVRSWAEGSGREVGAIVEASTMWSLAQRWYGDRLGPEWRSRPRDAAQREFEDLDLTGDFWRLP